MNPQERSPLTEKTTTLVAITQFIKAITPLIWLGVILIIVIKIWGGISLEKVASQTTHLRPTTAQVSIPNYSESNLDQEIKIALEKARSQAELEASKKLDLWIGELTERLDEDFLPWYFNYFNQLYLGAKGIALDVSSLVIKKDYLKAQTLTEEFQRQFTKRVLKPEIAQLKLERFTGETISFYIAQLQEQLAGIQSQYKIPQPDWDRYLEGISATVNNSSSDSQNLSLRALSRGSGYLIALPLTKASVKLGTGLVTKFAQKAAAKTTTKMATKMATKTAAKVASEFSVATIGLQLIDPLAALGILAWDVWDHYHTVAVEKPKMREAILEYFQEIKQALLYNSSNSIMSALYDFEAKVIKQLPSNQKA